MAGNGTSMISLLIPPDGKLSAISQMLTEEYGTATNIKSRVNKLSVLSAITSAQQRVKRYNHVPSNGLVIFVGTVMMDGKEKKIAIDFEPFKPINTSLYLCDSKFHVEALKDLLESNEIYGFVIMDGHSTLFGSLSGSVKEILHKFSVDLPNKQRKGGQSSVRFSRLRDEKRHNYVRKVAEECTHQFIKADKPNVNGLILAGHSDFKNVLFKSDLFDARLKEIVINVVDVSYGGENGFNQAIELSKELLSNVKYLKEKQLLSDYFTEIAEDTGKVCYGLKDTMTALALGVIERLIIWEDFAGLRLKDKDGRIEYCIEEQFKKEYEEKISILEWLIENYESSLEIITNNSPEGSQFCKGFGGIGGLLRYKIDLNIEPECEDEEIDPLKKDEEELFI